MTQEMTLQAIQPFFYIVATGSVLTTATATVTLTLATDSWFKLLVIEGISSISGATTIFPNDFTVTMTDQSTGRQFSSAPVPQALFCGPSNQSIVERYPIRFAPGITLVFAIVNTNGSTASITLALKGYKEFVTSGGQ